MPVDIFILIGILILLIWCGLQEYAITNIVKDMEKERKKRSALRFDQICLDEEFVELYEMFYQRSD